MKFNKFFVIILVTLFLQNSIFSLSVPNLSAPVVDNAKLISNRVEEKINNQLKELSDSTGIQVAVLTIPSLKGEVLELYSMKVEEKDTGVLLLVALEERSIRIEVGYGLEGVLTDTKCGLIIRNVMAPEFREGDYQSGIVDAVNNIVGLVKGDESLVSKSVLSESSDTTGPFVFMGIILLYGIIFIIAVINSKKRGIRIGGIPVTPQIHHVHRNFPRGGSGFSGGGFSGGGGSFGGGGASGGW